MRAVGFKSTFIGVRSMSKFPFWKILGLILRARKGDPHAIAELILMVAGYGASLTETDWDDNTIIGIRNLLAKKPTRLV